MLLDFNFIINKISQNKSQYFQRKSVEFYVPDFLSRPLLFLCDCLITILISVSYESVLVIVYLTLPVPQCRSVSTQILLISRRALLILTIVYHLLTYLSTCQDIRVNNSILCNRSVRPIEETSMSMVQPYHIKIHLHLFHGENVPYILRYVDTMSAIKGSNMYIYPLPLQI